MKLLLFLLFLCAATVHAATGAARAEPLPAERHALVQAGPYLRYDRAPASNDGGRAGFVARLALGGTVAYAAGLDLDAGVDEQGAVYSASLSPVGAGLRVGDAGFVAVIAGVGVDRVQHDAALVVPVEVRARAQVGSVRMTAWGAVRPTPLSEARATAYEGALAVGWGHQDTYWHDTSSGSGPYLALATRRERDDYTVSILVGIEMLGAN